jgi:glycerophosphoryl diester phosphodiesterase
MLTKFQKLIWSDYDHDVPSAEAYWAIGKGLNVDVDKSVLLAPGGKDIIKFAHENDLIVNTWTVNDETERDQLIKLGVDQVSTNCTF